jgi:hypothetical protein
MTYKASSQGVDCMACCAPPQPVCALMSATAAQLGVEACVQP